MRFISKTYKCAGEGCDYPLPDVAFSVFCPECLIKTVDKETLEDYAFLDLNLEVSEEQQSTLDTMITKLNS